MERVCHVTLAFTAFKGHHACHGHRRRRWVIKKSSFSFDEREEFPKAWKKNSKMFDSPEIKFREIYYIMCMSWSTIKVMLVSLNFT